MNEVKIKELLDKLKMIGGKDSASTTVYIIYTISVYLLVNLPKDIDEQGFKTLFVLVTSVFGIILTFVQNKNNTEKNNLKGESIQMGEELVLSQKTRVEELSALSDSYTQSLHSLRFLIDMLYTAIKSELPLEPILKIIERDFKITDPKEAKENELPNTERQ